ERCMLLFRAVEVLNAAHAGPRRDSMERYLRTLTPDRLDELARKHSLTPLYPTHARMGITAGSDDHGLLNVGRAWTGVPRPEDGSSRSTRDFLDRVMRAEAVIGGEQGGSNVLAHQIASVAASHYERTIHPNLSPRGRHIGSRLARFAGVRAPSPSKPRLVA